MYYYLICLTETDGDYKIIPFNAKKDIKKYLKKHNLSTHKDDYDIIEGKLLTNKD